MTTFRITPIQWTPRGPGDAEALAEQFANYLAGLSGPWRMLSLTRRFSFDTLRAELNQQAAALEAARERASDGDFWRWRWTKNYRRMYDDWERLEPPLAVEHYLLYQPAEPLAPQALADTLREQFLLPAVEPAALPALIPGRYREHATYLEPLDGPRYPFLRVLTAHDVRGAWHFGSWRPLLMSSWELALCIDVHTLSTDQADRRGTDALNALDQAVNGQFAIPDKRSRRAWESADYAVGALDRSALHEVAYAVLLRAPTRELLDRETHRLTAALGSRLKLDTVPGAQAAYARLFMPQGAHAITEPIVRRNTLSIGVAYKIPWTVRKTARDRGVCFGYNRDEGMPILVDVFGDRGDENAHLLAIGQSNSGKTVTLSCLALRLATAGAQVIFFDPVGKCRLLCEAVGPSAAFYEVDTTGSLNILDRMTDDLGTQRAAIERRLSVVLGRPDYGAGRVGLRARELTNLEVGAIDQCLTALYADASRTPLLSDLVRELKALGNRPGLEPRVVEAGADLAAEIASVLLGSRGALLNAPTTIRWDFGAPVTGYSFRNVVSTDKALMPLMYDLGWEALNRYVRTRPGSAPPVVVILDELAYMSVTPEFQANVALATKAWRNFRAFMWTADQDAATYFGADGRASRFEQYIAGNTFIKLLFRQEGNGAQILAAAYGDQLAPEHMQQIKTAPKGHLIGVFGDEVHPLVFQVTDLERRYFFAQGDTEADG